MSSPSSIGRESTCLASVVLPHFRSVGPRMVRGTELHAFMAARAQATTEEEREEALLEVPEEWRSAAAAINWERMPTFSPETGVAELALAWDPSTGEVRELGRNGDVEHDDLERLKRPGEYAGIIDWLSLVGDDGVFVVDFKFGYQALERAEVNGQIRSYCFMAARHFERKRAIGSFARIFDTGQVAWDIAEMDEMKLDSAEAFVRQHLKNAEAARQAYAEKKVIPVTVEGLHCTYCPAFRFCPAKAALLLSALTSDPSLPPAIAAIPQPLDHDAVARLWPMLKRAEKLIEQLLDVLRDYTRVHGAVKLPTNNVLGEFEQESRSIDVTFARPVLEARFGPEWTNWVIKTTEKLTFSGLDELAENHSSHGKKAKLLRTITAELEAAGAIRTVTVHRVGEVSAKSKKLKPKEEPPQLPEGEEQP